MKRIKYLVVTLCLFFINISFVSASNKINNIDVTATLDEKGNGHIIEVWDMKVDKGTEVYKPMQSLGNSVISNFEVRDENNNLYSYQEKWNTNGSLSSKANTNGINRTSDGLELCWGMSSYGNHIYTISYDVTNMVYNVEDAQVLYWRFINDSMDPAPSSFKVKVMGPVAYSDSLDIWGYGYKGYAYVKDGVIYMQNEENNVFKSSEYGVLLVKYPLGTFTTSNEIGTYSTFDEFLNAAKNGSYKYYDDNGNALNNVDGKTSIVEMVAGIISFVSFFGLLFFIIVVFSAKNKNYIKKEIDKKNLNNFRDIPCNKDVFKAYFLSEVFNLGKRKEDILGAIFLKWIKEDKMQVIKTSKSGLFGTKEVTSLQLYENLTFDNIDENKLYNMLIGASKDYILEPNELKNWSRDHYTELFTWFDKTKDNTCKTLISEGHITEVKKGKVIQTTSYLLDDSLNDDGVKLAGLKKYLIEFSRIKEKQPIEVKLWEYYLIYAEIFGIAEAVAKQFKDLYPEIIEQTANGHTFDLTDIMLINSLTSSSVSAASAARSAAQSYSAGGGGFSSGGGGGGSFGGSGGGCR